MIRLSVTFNTGPQAGRALAVATVQPHGEALLQLASNKLRLKKREAERARLFVWGRGVEVPRAGDVRALVANGEMIAVSLGEEYAGGCGPAAPPCAASPPADMRWSSPRPGLELVEWADADRMNRALGRMSTLLEHPLHCALESRGLVGVRAQRGLPSSRYLGHNLYAATFSEFERRAAAEARLGAEAGGGPADAGGAGEPGAPGMTSDEARFLEAWRARGCAEVVVSFVSGAAGTLSHELCHARYALEPSYRHAAEALWAEHAGRLGGWMRDLGYHASRHADEFCAYLLTEPAAFWRGRLNAADVRHARALLPAGAADEDARAAT